jgi:GH24 family phage-related lysozyme (muramidase)
LENDWTLDPAIQSELSNKWYDQPDVLAGIKLNTITVKPEEDNVPIDDVKKLNYEGKDVEAFASDKVYADYLKDLEKFIPKAKQATKGEEELTIGYGHYGEDVKPDQTITEEEADELLAKDIQKRMPQIIKAIPNFNNFSENLRKNIVSSWFRGSLSGSPKTIELINQGKLKEASKEFLNNDEYRNAKERQRSGIRPRMEATSKALANE